MASWNSISFNSPLGILWAAVFAIASVGCRHAADLIACIPPDSSLIAGADVAALRASPLYPKAPAAARAFLAQFTGVSSALAAYNGAELLVAARGDFHGAPGGATMIAPDIALFGSPRQVAAARAQWKTGRAGAPQLLAQAEAVSAGKQVWIAARGDTPLPITGNIANLIAILRNARFITLTAQVRDDMALELRASARDANAARAMEETLRADLTLAAAGEARQAALAKALTAAQVSRAESEVRVSIRLTNDDAVRLLDIL
jgi:hypothetical protein